jgi:deoxyribonuclease-4
MGKKNQLGTLDEVIELCRLDPRLVPVVDFGHLNARECGGVFRGVDDYRAVFDKIGTVLGDEVARNLHCHFSKIEWTEAGEKKHLTFSDTVYGPAYEPLAEAIYRERLTPTIVCESAGTQAYDALAIKQYFEGIKA